MAHIHDTIELLFDIPPESVERLIAELDTLGCEGLLEEKHSLKAYFPVSEWDNGKATTLSDWMCGQALEPVWRETRIEAKDWNEPWEQSIQPIHVPPFYVRPGWANPPPPAANLIDIVIDPKMSFGTGHHESTRLVLKSLPAHIKPGDEVLDAGSGTAILAIAAVKSGAGSVVAFDIDPWACDNARENLARNDVSGSVDFREGSLEAVGDAQFDLIVANINRKVLVDYMPAFSSRLKRAGRLVIAGVLRSDREIMIDAASKAGLSMIGEAEEGEWWSGQFSAL